MTISNLTVELKLMAENFNNGLRNAQREAKEFEKTIRPMTAAMADVGGAMTLVGGAMTAVGGGFALWMKSAINYGDELLAMSEKTGVSVERLSGWKLGLEQSNTTLNALETGLKTFSKSVSGPVDTALLAMADRFASMPNGAEKTTLAVKMFGKAGTDLIPFLNQGSAGILKMEANSALLHTTMSTKTAKAANDFSESLDKLKASFAGVANTIISSGLLEKLTGFANSTADLIAQVSTAHPWLVTIVGVVGALGAVFGPPIASIGLLMSGFAAIIPHIIKLALHLGFTSAGLGTALSAVGAVLTGPFGIVVAIGAAIFAVNKFVMANETLVKILDPVWTTIGNAINTTVDFIKNLWGGLWDFIVGAPGRAKDAILGGVKSVTDGVTGAFKSMYEAVVGNSYVPDMLDRIQEEFGRLPNVMEAPVKIATDSVEGFFGGMFGRITDGLKNWKNSLGGILGGVGNAIGGSAGSVLKTIGGIGSSFASGDVFGGISQSVGALINVFKSFGSGRKTANEFVQQFQEPFADTLIQIHDAFFAAAGTGKLTIEAAAEARKQVEQLWEAFTSQANRFASQGSDEFRVVQQAFNTMTTYFGQDLSTLFGNMQGVIAGLTSGLIPAAEGATSGIMGFNTSLTSFADMARVLTASVTTFVTDMGKAVSDVATLRLGPDSPLPGFTTSTSRGRTTVDLGAHWEDTIFGPRRVGNTADDIGRILAPTKTTFEQNGASGTVIQMFVSVMNESAAADLIRLMNGAVQNGGVELVATRLA